MYLDAAQDRVADQVQSEFDSTLEAVRAGTIFAHDNKQYRKHRSRSSSRRLSQPSESRVAAMNLERQIAALAATNPEYVVRGIA